MHRCDSCQASKAKQKAVPNVSNHVPADKPGQRFYLDLSKISKPAELKTMGKSNWLMIVNELSKLKFSIFHQTKKGMIEPTCVLFNNLKTNGYLTKIIRCDNAEENQSLQKHINGSSWKLNVDFEYAARATPKQNSLAETSFAAILNKAKTMMVDTNVLCLQQHKIMQEAVKTATKLIVKRKQDRNILDAKHLSLLITLKHGVKLE